MGGVSTLLFNYTPEMWFNRPAYYSYTPSGHGYWSFEDPHARAVARERAAREREAAAHRAELLRWQRMQDAARSPYNSYPSHHGSVSYPYNPRTSDYATHEELERQRILERQRQLELVRQTELIRRREEERVQELEERTSQQHEPASTSAPHFSVPISPLGGPPPTTLPTKPTLSKYTSPSVTQEATPEQIQAAMTIQEFYRGRVARQQALASIAELSTQFEQFKSAFYPPPQLDYRGAAPDDTITIPVSAESFVYASPLPPSSGDVEDSTETSKSNPRLAFTPNNKVVLEYIENLDRLVDRLDRVESGGHPSVREQRKQMIRNVEAEAQRVDRWIAAAWKPAQARRKY